MDYQNQQPPSSDLFDFQPVVYGTFWERFAAALIDGIILFIPQAILRFVFDDTPGNLLGLVISWLYYSLQESSLQRATIGKRAMGIKVTDLNGQQISFGRATGRHFAQYLSAAILLIGYFMMLWDDNKQTLHDKIADTLVVKRQS